MSRVKHFAATLVRKENVVGNQGLALSKSNVLHIQTAQCFWKKNLWFHYQITSILAALQKCTKRTIFTVICVRMPVNGLSAAGMSKARVRA